MQTCWVCVCLGGSRVGGQAPHLLPLVTRGLQVLSSTCSSLQSRVHHPPNPRFRVSVGQQALPSEPRGRQVCGRKWGQRLPCSEEQPGDPEPRAHAAPGGQLQHWPRVLLCPGAAVGRAQGGSGPASHAALRRHPGARGSEPLPLTVLSLRAPGSHSFMGPSPKESACGCPAVNAT